MYTPYFKNWLIWPALTIPLLLSSCNNKVTEPPKFAGEYTVITSATYSLMGKEGSTTPETEHVKISYAGGDTITLQSGMTFSKSEVQAIFHDSTFTIIPFRKDNAEATGSGVVTKNRLTIDITQSGVGDVSTHLEGQKDGTKDISSSPKLLEAKTIAKEIIDDVSKVEKKEMSKSAMDKHTKPLQKRLDLLRSELTPTEIKDLDSYRTALVNQIVDSKMKKR